MTKAKPKKKGRPSLGQRVEPSLRLGCQDHALLAQDTTQRRLGAADEGHTTPT